MPGGDRTGPVGMGPGSGRRMGFCAGYDRPGTFNRGGGFGMGMGRGRGNRNWFHATGAPYWTRGFEPNPEMEMSSLKAQADALKSELQEIEKRLEALGQASQKQSEA